MSANLYDLLDVDESASAEEIRAAWKAAIADLDPTDRRFRAYNDAAGVLLDDGKRASYDAELAAARVEAADAEAADAEAADAEAPDETAATVVDEQPDSTEPDDDSVVVEAAPRRRLPSSGPSKGLMIGAAVAAVLAVALATWVLTLPGTRAEDSPREVAARGQSQDKAALAAEGAAEQMVTPVLSYNHKTMAEDLERLKGFLTTKMADKQSAAWPELTKEAQAQEIVVEAKPTGTALTRVDPDGKRATVVVFIDQFVQKKADEPFVLRMWATMSLVREGGDGRWLLDDLCTDDSCG